MLLLALVGGPPAFLLALALMALVFLFALSLVALCPLSISLHVRLQCSNPCSRDPRGYTRRRGPHSTYQGAGEGAIPWSSLTPNHAIHSHDARSPRGSGAPCSASLIPCRGSDVTSGYARVTAFVPEEASAFVVVTARGDEVRSPVINEIGFSEWALHQGSMIALCAEIDGDLVDLGPSY